MTVNTNTDISVFAVANTFIKLENERGNYNELTNLKLQKLCYFAQAYTIVSKDTFLFYNKICAYPYGPVIKDLYDKLKLNDKYKSYTQEIYSNSSNSNRNEKALDLNSPYFVIIEKVYEQFASMDPWVLSQITHQPGTPWSIAKSKKGIYSEITKQDILQYYR
ncbi:MAG: DUF4065 domain-containing protein [Psittacicella sp.]